ncbi:MAG TPA: FAD-dependent oxidoreductase [Solirubrobacter sp.]|nr:FAD-dependent oxidoreductase [Solirubrobacter sp.]
MSESAPRAAVVGAGPSGFYATDQLLKAGFEVDLLEVLPTPFGLVRAGVAPDHPKIKSVTRVYEKVAKRPGFRFYGCVELGGHISRQDLLDRYHVVLYAVGTAADNRLGIPGEDRPGSHGALEFVAWYNGHPDYADHAFDLGVERAVVIGNGNVAVDVARMLVLDPDEVALTDTADHAVGPLAAAQVRDVVVLGRRGPAQAAFTTPELRELGELTRADIIVDPGDLELDPHSAAWLEAEAEPTNQRNVDLLREYASRTPHGHSHRVELRFLRSPVEILGEGPDGRVTGVRVVKNRIEDGRAVPTGEEEIIPCGLVIRSIGYRGAPLAGIPFDERRGLISNAGGRVLNPQTGEPETGEYVVGWVKRGPSGVIGTNKKDATDTVARILEDRDAGRLNAPASPDPQGGEQFLAQRCPELVTWAGWRAIDEHETALGEPLGRPRVKLVRTGELIDVASGALR